MLGRRRAFGHNLAAERTLASGVRSGNAVEVSLARDNRCVFIASRIRREVRRDRNSRATLCAPVDRVEHNRRAMVIRLRPSDDVRGRRPCRRLRGDVAGGGRHDEDVINSEQSFAADLSRDGGNFRETIRRARNAGANATIGVTDQSAPELVDGGPVQWSERWVCRVSL